LTFTKLQMFLNFWRINHIMYNCYSFPSRSSSPHGHGSGSSSGAWFSWVWLRLRSSFFHDSGSSSGFCLFSHINIFNCLGVPQVEWKMNDIKYRELSEYTKLFW